jgi:site-specific DNA recombinase
MEKKTRNGVVLYVRVSTDEQADPANLENQEQRCRDYCKRHGMSVIKVFTDAGESARTAARPQYQLMLAFCRENRRKVGYVVVQDLSRFARDSGDQANGIVELKRSQILLRSVYEPNVDETAAGRLAANMLGAFNQYFSDALSEKMRDRTRQAVFSGRFPWKAPIGYINTGAKAGPNIKPDEKRAPLIRRAFDLMASGRHKAADVLRIVTDEGLTTAKGRALTKQTFQAMLRNPLYAGWVTLPSDPDIEPVKGLHAPIVSQETFDRVQAILDGRRPSIVAKAKVNPVVPLRGFIRCDCCGTRLTGGSPQGRGGKKYPRYWCPNPECRKVSLSKEQLESEFGGVLGRLRAKPEAARDLPAMAAKVWRDKQGDSEREMARLQVIVDQQRRYKTELFKMRMRGEIDAQELEEQKARLTVEMYETEEKMRVVADAQASSDSFLRFAQLQLMDMRTVWEMAGPEERQRVQNLLFDGALSYDPNAGILNRSKSSLFSVLETIRPQNGKLVGPPGLEPGTNGL